MPKNSGIENDWESWTPGKWELVNECPKYYIKLSYKLRLSKIPHSQLCVRRFKHLDTAKIWTELSNTPAETGVKYSMYKIYITYYNLNADYTLCAVISMLVTWTAL